MPLQSEAISHPQAPIVNDIPQVLDALEAVGDDEVAGNRDEDKTELEVILEDLEQGIEDPTLPRVSEEDVAYNMDEVEVEVSDDETDSGSDSGGESGCEWD